MTNELLKLKLPVTKTNLADYVFDSFKVAKLTLHKLIKFGAALALENMCEQSKGNGPQWQAQRIHCSYPQDKIEDFHKDLEKAVKSQHECADVLMKASRGLLWLAVIYRHPDDENVSEMPIYVAISEDFHYLFNKKAFPIRLTEAIKKVTKCRKVQPMNLSGRDVVSLLLLLRGRESSTAPRPIFEPHSPKINGPGCDFTRGCDVKHYTKQCLGESIQLEQYSVEPANKRWMGDVTPELRLIEFKSEVIFSGDVSALFAALPAAGICNPPFPDYIRDFSVIGRSHVSSSV